MSTASLLLTAALVCALGVLLALLLTGRYRVDRPGVLPCPAAVAGAGGRLWWPA